MIPLSCEEFAANAASFALGALEPEEMERARAHLLQQNHDGCTEALRKAEDTLVQLSRALVPIRPRPEVWLEIDRLVDKRSVQDGAPRRPSRLPWLVAAAALIFGAMEWSTARSLRKNVGAMETTLASTGSIEQRARIDCLHSLAEARAEAELQKKALDALQEPNVELVALAPKGDAPTVRAVWNPTNKTAFVIARGAIRAADKDFELWVIRGQEKIAAGLLKPDANGVAILEIDRNLLQGPVDAFVVTLEPAGGGPIPLGPAVNVGVPKKG